MQVLFAFGLEVKVREFPVVDNQRPFARTGLQDDTYLIGSAGTIVQQWPQLKECLAQAGHNLRSHKSQVWAPAFDQQPHQADQDAAAPTHQAEGPSRQMPNTLVRLFEILPRVTGGIEMLGSAAGGEWSAVVGDEQQVDAHAAKRTAAAVQLAQRLKQMAASHVDDKIRHKTWFMITKVVASALTYDARIVPREHLEQHSQKVDVAVQEAVEALLPEPLTEQQHQRARLPGHYGGLGL